MTPLLPALMASLPLLSARLQPEAAAINAIIENATNAFFRI
jgi:hypothetical protein